MATMFQQRHFETIATLMQEAREQSESWTGVQQWEIIRNLLADTFQENNPHFDRGRFERACVPGANVRARS